MERRNRLADATSPYLLQHAGNPVDWHPWDEQALALAREEDRPIFLSVGYSACHWCHVMERESFENEAIAAVLNRHFVPIKVDREERPDLDEIYMLATQLTTGSGGWPMSVFLTPDGRPFLAGTYFPPEDRWGRPGFRSVLERVAQLWQERRDEVERQADRLAAAVAEYGAGEVSFGPVTMELVERALDSFRASFDPRDGGFGGAPKFPPSMRLELLLRRTRRQPDEGLQRIVEVTLDRMARGGMYDQIGGGFHRYSVDEHWLVPHFEKMLYDNALLARVYALAWEATGRWYWGRVARETLDYVLREMTDPEGGFYSATDADSEGEEGKYFVWTPEEVEAVLGTEAGQEFCAAYDVTPRGNFEGKSIPNLLAAGIDELAARQGLDPEELDRRLAGYRDALREARSRRVPPLRDDKVLTAWNGLMLRAFVEGARVFGEPRYRAAAERSAEFLLTRLADPVREGGLLRSWREGRADLNAYLEDYACLALALLDLHGLTGDERWRTHGLRLLDQLLERFWDAAGGGFFFTSSDHEALLARSRPFQDGATPGGNSTAAQALLRAFRLTGEPRYRSALERILVLAGPQMARFPAACPNMLVAADEYLEDFPAGLRFPGADAVEIDGLLSRDAVAPGEAFWVAVRLRVAPGFHLNSRTPREPHLLPTTVEVAPGSGVEVLRRSDPPAERIEAGGETLSVYRGEVVLGLELRFPPDTPRGRKKVPVVVRMQPCDDEQCHLPVEARLEFAVDVRPGAPGGENEPELFAEIRARATDVGG